MPHPSTGRLTLALTSGTDPRRCVGFMRRGHEREASLLALVLAPVLVLILGPVLALAGPVLALAQGLSLVIAPTIALALTFSFGLRLRLRPRLRLKLRLS